MQLERRDSPRHHRANIGLIVYLRVPAGVLGPLVVLAILAWVTR